MYVCIYIYMYVCISLSTYIYIYILTCSSVAAAPRPGLRGWGLCSCRGWGRKRPASKTRSFLLFHVF